MLLDEHRRTHRIITQHRIDDHALHVLVQQRAREADVNGRLLLVAGEDEDGEIGTSQLRDCIRHAHLQFVLNGRRTCGQQERDLRE